MSYGIHVRRAAERDVAEAQGWYEAQQSGLAARFHEEIVAPLGLLAVSPLMYPELYRNVRRAVLHRFPYLIWYRVQDSTVTVLVCTHAKISPARARRCIR